MFGRTLLLLATSGCGSLAAGDYYGEPLLTLSGNVVTDGLDPAYDDLPIGVGILWTFGIDASTEAQAAVVRTAFPARYTVDFFRPPDSGDRPSLLGDPDFEGVVGLPVLYVDRQEDGVWSPEDGEEVVGGSYDTAVIYSTRMPDWFAAEAGEHAATGFVPVVVDDRDLCGGRATGGLVLPNGQPAHLYVGTLTPALRDWDCDGRDDEWSQDHWSNEGSCPPDDVVTHECAELLHNLEEADTTDEFVRLRDILATDPTWTACLRAECPEVISGIEQG